VQSELRIVVTATEVPFFGFSREGLLMATLLAKLEPTRKQKLSNAFSFKKDVVVDDRRSSYALCVSFYCNRLEVLH
jgi:hypothetical protein